MKAKAVGEKTGFPEKMGTFHLTGFWLDTDSRVWTKSQVQKVFVTLDGCTGDQDI